MDLYPRIRSGIEAIPARYEGRDVLVLKDRTGVSADLAVDRGSAIILALLNGATSLRDIQVTMMRQQGLGLISMEEIQRLVEALDDHFLLDNERYRNHLREISRQFRQERLRKATHAGHSYPDDPEALHAQLESHFRTPEGPGLERPDQHSRKLIGLIAPHIDFQRGGYCYAWGYSALPNNSAAELYVILGTCHLPMEHPFALTTKVFETPLGQTPSAGDLAEAIAQRAGLDLFHDELAHRSEHTIEFQVVYLQYLLGPRKDFQILPVLCGGFHEMITQRILPAGHDPYRRGLEALMEVLDISRQNTCFIASADLAHLGPQFGDPRPVQPGDLPNIQRQDQATLQCVLDADADGFYRTILSERDCRRICGLPPIYTLLRLLAPEEIRLLKYGQAFHPQATVTFASIGFWDNK